MKDNREFCVRSVLEMLVEIRGFEFQTLIAEQTQYLRGLLAGMMHADAIDGDEFKRLNELAWNAYQVRNNELFELALTRAAA
jgi:hypothetical protein